MRRPPVPVPEPPDPGELRKVKLVYRCSVCGTEVRMTAAVAEEPLASLYELVLEAGMPERKKGGPYR